MNPVNCLISNPVDSGSYEGHLEICSTWDDSPDLDWNDSSAMVLRLF